jgi:hypothetical protein
VFGLKFFCVSYRGIAGEKVFSVDGLMMIRIIGGRLDGKRSVDFYEITSWKDDFPRKNAVEIIRDGF